MKTSNSVDATRLVQLVGKSGDRLQALVHREHFREDQSLVIMVAVEQSFVNQPLADRGAVFAVNCPELPAILRLRRGYTIGHSVRFVTQAVRIRNGQSAAGVASAGVPTVMFSLDRQQAERAPRAACSLHL